MALNFPYPANTNDSYTLGDITWIYDGYAWVISGNKIGYTGSAASTGDITFNTNIISSLNTNENIKISPNGTGKIDINSHYIINVNDPINAQDVATKSYVDSQLSSTSQGFLVSTIGFPAATGDYDLAQGEVPFTNTYDAFGVFLSDLYDEMEPNGNTLTYDLNT